MVGMWAAAVWQRVRRTWGMLRATKRRRIISTTIIVLVVIMGMLRLWTWWPDTVHITVTQRNGNGYSHVIYDRTINDAAIAQRLQQDVAAFSIDENPLHSYSCGVSGGTYTLQWSRFGIITEVASETECSSMWMEDGVITHIDTTHQGLLPDLTALGVPHPLTPDQLAQPTP